MELLPVGNAFKVLNRTEERPRTTAPSEEGGRGDRITLGRLDAAEAQIVFYRRVLGKVHERVVLPGPARQIHHLGLDTSPEATADRISDLAIKIFRYAGGAESPDTPGFQAQLESVRDGIRQGYREAREILGAFGITEGNIHDNIEKTMSLVESKLDEFSRQVLCPGS